MTVQGPLGIVGMHQMQPLSSSLQLWLRLTGTPACLTCSLAHRTGLCVLQLVFPPIPACTPCVCRPPSPATRHVAFCFCFRMACAPRVMLADELTACGRRSCTQPSSAPLCAPRGPHAGARCGQSVGLGRQVHTARRFRPSSVQLSPCCAYIPPQSCCSLSLPFERTTVCLLDLLLDLFVLFSQVCWFAHSTNELRTPTPSLQPRRHHSAPPAAPHSSISGCVSVPSSSTSTSCSSAFRFGPPTASHSGWSNTPHQGQQQHARDAAELGKWEWC